MTSSTAKVRRQLYEGRQYWLRRAAGGRFATLCKPTWISFLITERCNARCLHCDIWKNKGKEDGPSQEQWSAALKDLRDWLGPVHVCLTGGEALLRPYTVDLMEYGSRLGLLMELLTHGYWKDQTRIEAVARTRPWRITLSVDGIGDTHDRVRGRDDFFERTSNTIETLKRVRAEEGLDFSIRLKTVVMSHNLHNLGAVAEYATQPGMDVLYQAIEQNYAQQPVPDWYRHTDNWPADPEQAVRAVEGLIELKNRGLSIANSTASLEHMMSYFRDPGHLESHEWGADCSALALFQVNSNGDVQVCWKTEPVGNIKEARPRDVWAARPHFWESGCCLERNP